MWGRVQEIESFADPTGYGYTHKCVLRNKYRAGKGINEEQRYERERKQRVREKESEWERKANYTRNFVKPVIGNGRSRRLNIIMFYWWKFD